jgi:hypothetical protein
MDEGKAQSNYSLKSNDLTGRESKEVAGQILVKDRPAKDESLIEGKSNLLTLLSGCPVAAGQVSSNSITMMVSDCIRLKVDYDY